jgi:hypothetical protein
VKESELLEGCSYYKEPVVDADALESKKKKKKARRGGQAGRKVRMKEKVCQKKNVKDDNSVSSEVSLGSMPALVERSESEFSEAECKDDAVAPPAASQSNLTRANLVRATPSLLPSLRVPFFFLT